MKQFKSLVLFICFAQSIYCNIEQININVNNMSIEDIKLVLNEAEKKGIPIKVVLNNINKQINLIDFDSNFQCCHGYGSDFIGCKLCLNKLNLKKYFSYLGIYAALYYIESLYSDEFIYFLNAFTDNEWQNYWKNLNHEDRQKMPKTLLLLKESKSQDLGKQCRLKKYLRDNLDMFYKNDTTILNLLTAIMEQCMQAKA